MGDSVNFEAFVSLFDLFLEVDALESLLAEPTSLSEQLCTHVKVEDEIWLDQSSICSEAPIETQTL